MTEEFEDFLLLSGIQHFAFCRRQWALIHIEQQWAENLRTVEGALMHERAHDPYLNERRGDLIVSRAMAVKSRALGVCGVCDIVEFRRDDAGVELFGRAGKYKAYPVEYKRGKPKESDIDILQLTAQAMCIEEMLCTTVDRGFIYYGETKHRIAVDITSEMRESVASLFAEMREMYDRRHTPRVKRTKACNACSLAGICLPALDRVRSASGYINAQISEDEA